MIQEEIIRLVVNKSIVPKRPKRRGRKGYGAVLAVRILVYMVLARILTDKGLVRHLQKHQRIARILGLKKYLTEQQLEDGGGDTGRSFNKYSLRLQT